MRKTLTSLDHELKLIMELVGRIERGELHVLDRGVEATAAHRDQLLVLLKDLLEVRSRITIKMSDHIDREWQDAKVA